MGDRSEYVQWCEDAWRLGDPNAESVCWISYTLEGIDYHPTEDAARAHVEAWTSRYVEANRRLPDESGWVARVTADLVVEFDLVVRGAVGLQWVTLTPPPLDQAQALDGLHAEIDRLRAHGVVPLPARGDVMSGLDEHVCTVCFRPSTAHREQDERGYHWPPLCCPRCDCGPEETPAFAACDEPEVTDG